jgi:hypothetical protein
VGCKRADSDQEHGCDHEGERIPRLNLKREPLEHPRQGKSPSNADQRTDEHGKETLPQQEADDRTGPGAIPGGRVSTLPILSVGLLAGGLLYQMLSARIFFLSALIAVLAVLMAVGIPRPGPDEAPRGT